jgi:acetyl esterase/lipase
MMAAALLLLGLTGCRVTNLPLWGPAPSADACAVECIRDVPYYDGPDADPLRHHLDLFLPRGEKDFPVVVLVHGGAWIMGDNRCCGLYSSVGEFLAGQGIGAVLPNYRLSPGVKHPKHVKDVARAVAWTYKHIAEHGGRPDRIFLCGHSAGGHLVALLATDERYLKAEGLPASAIRGVIAVSGVYRIPPGKFDATLGGGSEVAFRFDEVAPLRCARGRPWVTLPGIPLSLNVFGPAFGNDPRVREDASPLSHVRPGLPPFLLLSAGNDLPTLSGMAEEFCRALRREGCDAQLRYVEDRNHNSILFRAVSVNDPVALAMLEFIGQHVATPAP